MRDIHSSTHSNGKLKADSMIHEAVKHSAGEYPAKAAAFKY